MLQNAYLVYLLAKIGADTAENERNFAENLPKIGKDFGSAADARPPRRPLRAPSGAQICALDSKADS